MIVFIGDLHSGFEWLPNILKDVPRDATLIQVGDFGFWPGHPKGLWDRTWSKLGFEKPMYAIDGNHEYFPMIYHLDKPTEVWDGVIYIPRGTAMEIEGKKFGFLGGGGSIDYKLRRTGMDWFPEEQVTEEQFQKLYDVDHIDILVTHVPPTSATRANFPHPADVPHWTYLGLTKEWWDQTQNKVELLWVKFGKPRLFCGHMHRSVIYDTIRMLDINETYELR